jgi:transcriptional regulator with XRE-family HTH domain
VGERSSGPLATSLRRLRHEAGWSQEELARRAGLSVRTVSDLERGIHPVARRSTVAALARVLPGPASDVLRAANDAGAAEPRPDLPPRLQADADEAVFVGRAAALSVAEQAWQRVASQRTTALVAVDGLPGMGRTRLVRAVAERRVARGAPVLFGRCDEVPSDPYQAFLEALSSFDPSTHATVLGPLPDGGGHHPAWEWLERVRSWFAGLTSRGPALLVLDDLHWAAASDLVLLRHLVRPPGAGGLLVLLTYASGRTTAADLVDELSRDADVERITLDGLSRSDVRHLVAEAGGRHLTGELDDVAASLHVATDGNAFAVTELVRRLADGGTWSSSALRRLLEPGALEDVAHRIIDTRVAALPPATRRLVDAAAVLGADVELDVLATVLDTDADALIDAAEPALALGVLRDRTDVPGWSFSQTMAPGVLAERISANRRARLHLRSADALEAAGAPLAVVAHHRLAALPHGDRLRTADAARAAARRARADRAWDEVAALTAGVAEALEGVDGCEGDRVDALLASGEAQLHALARQDARVRFREAADLAERLRPPDAHRLARAARGYAYMTKAGAPDADARSIWQGALDAHPSPALRATLLAAIAIDRHLAGDGSAPGDAAVVLAEAERAGDPHALAMALATSVICQWGWVHPTERLDRAVRLTELGAAERQPDIVLDGLELQGVPLLELGRRREFEDVLDRLRDGGERAHRRISVAQAVQWSAMLRLLDGDADAGTELADRAAELARGAPNFSTGHAAQRYSAARLRGTEDELLVALQSLVDETGGPTAWRAMLAATSADHGRRDEAIRHHEVLAAEGYLGLRRDWTWRAAACLSLVAAATVGDVPAVSLLEEQLTPFSGTLVVVASGTSCEGAVDHYLGRAALARGDRRLATARLQAALDLEEAVGGAVVAAESRALLDRLDKGNAAESAAEQLGGRVR